ncbi:helix-turn-helix domain-containing protein [Paenibacillus lentus]|nr:helix-turn-helix domain-containing protein [Paenibacillus lentus]
MISRYEVSSLKKGLQVLDLLKVHPILTITEISEELKLNKTTVFHLLYTLEEMEYVLKADKYYRLHPGMYAPQRKNAFQVDWSKMQVLYELGVKVARDLYIEMLEGTHVIVHQVYRAQTKEMMSQKVGSLCLRIRTLLERSFQPILNPLRS